MGRRGDEKKTTLLKPYQGKGKTAKASRPTNAFRVEGEGKITKGVTPPLKRLGAK